MPLIDRTYFVGELDIPGTDAAAVQQRLDIFINKYQYDLLSDVLGQQLYTGFIAGIAVPEPTAEWTRLKSGFEFSDQLDQLIKWRGFVEPEIKRSPIANYVYFHWQRDKMSQTTGVGEVGMKVENSVAVSPRHKMIRAWNEMCDWLMPLRTFLDHPGHPYTGWDYRYSRYLLRKYRHINEHQI